MTFGLDETQPERTLLAAGRTQASTLVVAAFLARAAIRWESPFVAVLSFLAIAGALGQSWVSQRIHTREAAIVQETRRPLSAWISAMSVALIALAGLVLSLTGGRS